MPNRVSQYSNAGGALPALTSRQREVGLEGRQRGAQLASGLVRHLAADDQHRPVQVPPAKCATTGARSIAAWRSGAQLEPGAVAYRRRRRGDRCEAARQRCESGAQWAIADQRAQGGAACAGCVPRHPCRASNSRGRCRTKAGATCCPMVRSPPSWTRVDAVLRYDTKLRAGHELDAGRRQLVRPPLLEASRPTSSVTCTCSRVRRARCVWAWALRFERTFERAENSTL